MHPVIEQLKRAGGFERDDKPKRQAREARGAPAQGTQKLNRVVPLVAALLSIPRRRSSPLPELTPQRQKELTLEALGDQPGGLSATQPVIVTYEDTHWIDPTTQELLGLAIDRVTPPEGAARNYLPAGVRRARTGQPHSEVHSQPSKTAHFLLQRRPRGK